MISIIDFRLLHVRYFHFFVVFTASQPHSPWNPFFQLFWTRCSDFSQLLFNTMKPSTSCRKLFLQLTAVVGHGEAAQEIQKADEQIGLLAESHPFGIGEDGLGGSQDIEKSDNHHEGSVLESRYENAHVGGITIFKAWGERRASW
jgi:hypothetical protein